MTTPDDLRTLREVMADPSNVVNNPHAMIKHVEAEQREAMLKVANG